MLRVQTTPLSPTEAPKNIAGVHRRPFLHTEEQKSSLREQNEGKMHTETLAEREPELPAAHALHLLEEIARHGAFHGTAGAFELLQETVDFRERSA